GMSRYSRNFEETVLKSFCRMPRLTPPSSKSSWAAAGRARARAHRARRLLRFIAPSLPTQIRAAGRIAAVDVLVAVLAGVLHGAVAGRGGRARRVDVAVEGSRVPRVQVAPLAEPRLLGDQHLVVVGAVRVVAVQAVLPHRRVLPEERPALLRVALIAELVGPVRANELRLAAVVHVVTAR